MPGVAYIWGTEDEHSAKTSRLVHRPDLQVCCFPQPDQQTLQQKKKRQQGQGTAVNPFTTPQSRFSKPRKETVGFKIHQRLTHHSGLETWPSQFHASIKDHPADDTRIRTARISQLGRMLEQKNINKSS